MEEKLDRLNKNVEDLTEIVVSVKDYMENNLVTKDELTAVEEKLSSKMGGLQRAIDAGYERDSALEARVTKVETELHL